MLATRRLVDHIHAFYLLSICGFSGIRRPVTGWGEFFENHFFGFFFFFPTNDFLVVLTVTGALV